MHRSAPIIAVIAGTLSGLPCGPVCAATDPVSAEDAEKIRALVEAAKLHREAGQAAEALESLHEAIAIEPAPWLFYSVARMHEDAGRNDLALAWYSLCVGRDADADTRKRADKRVQALGSAGLRINIVEFKLSPPDAELLIDGAVWNPRLGRVLSISIGTHTITVRHPGFVPAESSLVVDGPLPQTFAVALAPPAPIQVEAPPAVVLAQPTRMNDGPGVMPWVVAGVGLGVATLGTWLVVDGNSDWDEVDSARSDLSLTREQADALVADGTTKRTLGFTSLGVGGAMVLSGLLWYALWDGDDAPTVVLVPGITAAKVRITGRF